MMKNAGHEWKKTYGKKNTLGFKELKMHEALRKINKQMRTNI